MDKLADLIKQKRKEHKLTQVELAAKTGLALKLIRSVEQGGKSFQTEKLNQLLNFFGYELAPKPLNREHIAL